MHLPPPKWSLLRGWHIRAMIGPFPGVLIKFSRFSRPRPDAVQVVEAFAIAFPELAGSITQKLWPDYEAYREAVEDGLTVDFQDLTILSPEELWSHVRLSQIEVSPFGKVASLELGFEVSWDSDHLKGIGVENGGVTYLNGSIRGWA